MLIMTRLCFQKDDAPDGIAALQACGYLVLSHVYADEPDHVFVEATRDVDPIDPAATNADELEVVQKIDELDIVEKIVEPFGGSVESAGPVQADHVPSDIAYW